MPLTANTKFCLPTGTAAPATCCYLAKVSNQLLRFAGYGYNCGHVRRSLTDIRIDTETQSNGAPTRQPEASSIRVCFGQFARMAREQKIQEI